MLDGGKIVREIFDRSPKTKLQERELETSLTNPMKIEPSFDEIKSNRSVGDDEGKTLFEMISSNYRKRRDSL